MSNVNLGKGVTIRRIPYAALLRPSPLCMRLESDWHHGNMTAVELKKADRYVEAKYEGYKRRDSD